tara:strand:- start:271 stop:564 length:294 start_codon:yes stop_codon:yes gene_type:complete
MVWDYLILTMLIFNALLLVMMARMLAKIVQDELLALDAKLASALKQVIENGIGDFEPPNPIQVLLADLLKSKLGEVGSQPSELVEVIRAPDGKFASE